MYNDEESSGYVGRLTNERAEDLHWLQAKCEHTFKPLDAVSEQCDKCGEWHFYERYFS